ncbi:MAG TPA: hypothetical protein VKK79_01755 [Candidatus Lokiarchaeia archaeon]|nr:hypothetical protein [Candidatus Lokiarchaeia archaeon]
MLVAGITAFFAGIILQNTASLLGVTLPASLIADPLYSVPAAITLVLAAIAIIGGVMGIKGTKAGGILCLLAGIIVIVGAFIPIAAAGSYVLSGATIPVIIYLTSTFYIDGLLAIVGGIGVFTAKNQ